MFTCFHAVQWFAAAFVMVFAAVFCWQSWGWPGGIVGAAAGFFAGVLIGRLPVAISSVILRFQLKRASVEKLKQDLEEQYFVSHLLIAELIRRGEAVQQFWPYVLSLLKSDSDHKRRFGWHNLNIWFPEFAKQLDGFDPHASTETCRERIQTIEAAEPGNEATS